MKASGRLLVVTSLEGLTKRFEGSENELVRELEAIAEKQAPLAVLAVDSKAVCTPLGIAPSDSSAEGIRKASWRLVERWKHGGAPVEAVALLGGPEIVPHHELPNDTNDADEVVPSDLPYGVPPGGGGDTEKLLATLPVGRIPIQSTAGVRRLIARHGDGAPTEWFSLSAAQWSGASSSVMEQLEASTKSLLLSPKEDLSSIPKQWKAEANRFYFNLHGSDQTSEWYGQDGPEYPPVLAPELVGIEATSERGPVVVSEACYGAMLTGRDEKSAISLKFFEEGARAFVGSTVIAYGPPNPPIGCADLIALYFMEEVNRGETYGAALVEARRRLVETTLDQHHELPAAARKTLVEFILLANPLERWTDNPASTTKSRLQMAPHGTSVLDRTRRELARRVPQVVPIQQIVLNALRPGNSLDDTVARVSAPTLGGPPEAVRLRIYRLRHPTIRTEQERHEYTLRRSVGRDRRHEIVVVDAGGSLLQHWISK